MKIDDKRLKDGLRRADQFAAGFGSGDDRSCMIPAITACANAIRQAVDLAISTQDPAFGDRMEVHAIVMLEQLNGLFQTAIAVRLAQDVREAEAKLERDREARKTGGSANAEARKQGATFTKAKVESEAARLRKEGVAEHKLVTTIVKATGYSRTTVSTYLPEK